MAIGCLGEAMLPLEIDPLSTMAIYEVVLKIIDNIMMYNLVDDYSKSFQKTANIICDTDIDCSYYFMAIFN